MCKSLNSQYDEKLQRLQQFLHRLPDVIRQPKLAFIPGRKRALTGPKSALLQEEAVATDRRRTLQRVRIQSQNDTE